VREGVFILYLAQVGIDEATAVALALMMFGIRLLASLLGGVVMFFGGADLGVRERGSEPMRVAQRSEQEQPREDPQTTRTIH
jgi:hypothetical protein